MPTKSELQQQLAALHAENERLRDQLKDEDDEYDLDDDEEDGLYWVFPAIIGFCAGIWLG